MLYAIVMAGGSGTRFWPKSRRSVPKQLLRLHGDASMLQQTVARVAPMVPPERVLVITGADQAEAVREQLPDVPPDQVVAEPCPRDTAPCVGLAAAKSSARARPRRHHDRDAGRPRHRATRDVSEATVPRGRGGDRRGPLGVRDVRHQADPGRDRLRLHRARRVAGLARAGSPCTGSPSSARSPTGPRPRRSWPPAGSPGTPGSSSGGPGPSSTPWPRTRRALAAALGPGRLAPWAPPPRPGRSWPASSRQDGEGARSTRP